MTSAVGHRNTRGMASAAYYPQASAFFPFRILACILTGICLFLSYQILALPSAEPMTLEEAESYYVSVIDREMAQYSIPEVTSIRAVGR